MQEEAIFTRKESLLFCFFPFPLGIDTTDAVAVLLVFLFFLYIEECLYHGNDQSIFKHMEIIRCKHYLPTWKQYVRKST